MTPINTSRLIDAAVPPIPSHLLTPPIRQIRRRAIRRRAALGSCAAAVAVVVTSVGAIVAIGPSDDSSTVVGSSPTPTSAAAVTSTTPTNAAGSWRLARVDRAGTGLTVYVNPDPRACVVYTEAVPSVDERADAVIITVNGTGKTVACEERRVAQLHITLTQPLGTRTLRDGRDGTIARAYLDSDLPQVPLPWFDYPTGFSELDGSLWMAGLTRPGGPDLRFSASVGTVSDLSGQPVTLGSRQGRIRQNGVTQVVEWQVRDLIYTMMLTPREGATTSLAEAQAVINQLTWP